MKINIYPNQTTFHAVNKYLREMEKGSSATNVVRKSINEVSRDIKKQLHVETMSMYTIKPSVFPKSDIRRKTATGRKNETVILVKGEPLGIYKGYETRQNDGKESASARIKRSSVLKNLRIRKDGKSYKGFYLHMKNGHEGIFQRVPGKMMHSDPKKEMIKELISLSKSKAAEKAYEGKIQKEVDGNINLRLLKYMHAALGG